MSTRPIAPRRWLAVLALVVLAGLSALAALGARDLPQTERAASYARDVSISASATYVTLRTLNAFLTSAQELEVTGSVVFASGSAQPLKVLEPIDDTIERVAGVVFWIMLAAGVLSVTMAPLGALGFALLGVAALSGAAALGIGGRHPLRGVPRLLGAYGILLALGVPLAFLASSEVADRLTRASWAEHQRVISEISATVEADLPDEGGLRNAMEQLDRYRQLAVNLSSRADDLIGSLVGLLSIYIFKLIVLPVLVTLALVLVARRLAVPPHQMRG